MKLHYIFPRGSVPTGYKSYESNGPERKKSTGFKSYESKEA
jgi:hypothetical protein